MINNVATNSPVCVGVGKGMGGDHQVHLCVVQPISHSCNTHRDISCLVGESMMPLDLCGERDVVLLLYGPVHCGRVKLSIVE